MKTAGMKCSAFRLRAFKYAYEVGLEAGYNLLPVMEDKNLLAMNTVYTGHTASSDSGKQLRHPRS